MNYETKTNEIRQMVIDMLYRCQSGHPGGSLSEVEILTALYYNVMKVDPKNPHDDARDRFVLSKGHGCPTLYAILADLGFFPKSDLDSLRQVHSHLQGHPDMKKTPGIDCNTGSLGEGIAVAMGMALAAKHMKKSYRVFTLVGDGECQEGLVWEAAMAAAHYRLDNFVVMLDYNGLQIDGSNAEVMDLGDIVGKFEKFGFDCATVDGHDIAAITAELEKKAPGKPRFICCKTVKGKGVSFMENQSGWHGAVMSETDYNNAMKELRG